MSLLNWQTAILKMLPSSQLAADASPQKVSMETGTTGLSVQERASLAQVKQSAGLDVTRDIIEWWRQARLKIATPFSILLMQRLKLEDLLRRYQQEPCATLFFVREAQNFGRFLAAQPDVPVILKELVEFECEVHQMRLHKEQMATDKATSGLYPEYFYQLKLSHCPESCIAALINGMPLPDAVVGGVTVQINSQWLRLWRVL